MSRISARSEPASFPCFPRSLGTDGRSCEIFVSVSCRSHTNSLRRGASLKNIAIKKPQIRVVAKSTFFMVRVNLLKLWISASGSIALRVPIGRPSDRGPKVRQKFRQAHCLGKTDSVTADQTDGGLIELNTSHQRATCICLPRAPWLSDSAHVPKMYSGLAIPHRSGMENYSRETFRKIYRGAPKFVALGTRFFSTKYRKSIMMSIARNQRAAPDS